MAKKQASNIWLDTVYIDDLVPLFKGLKNWYEVIGVADQLDAIRKGWAD